MPSPSNTKAISPQDLEFLDQNGYVILRNFVSMEEVANTKARLKRLIEEESPRLAEYGYSPLRERLRSEKKLLQLRLFDLLFIFLKKTFRLATMLSYQFAEILKQYRLKPYNYRNKKAWWIEVRQMLICIIEQFENPRDLRVCDLVNKGEVFDQYYQDSRLLSLVEYIIGEKYKLSSLNQRAPQQNNYQQFLHVDFPWAVKPGDYYACNALFVLDDMNAENGATRVVPGSHNSGRIPHDEMVNPKDPHADEIILEAKAGDLIFLNSHIWHSGTINRNGKDRAIIQSYFVHPAHAPQQFQQFQLRDATRKRLSKEALALLDIY